MSLHICVSGLTSTQRNLKLASDKHLYNNKLWKDFVAEHNARSGSNDPEVRVNYFRNLLIVLGLD